MHINFIQKFILSMAKYVNKWLTKSLVEISMQRRKIKRKNTRRFNLCRICECVDISWHGTINISSRCAVARNDGVIYSNDLIIRIWWRWFRIQNDDTANRAPHSTATRCNDSPRSNADKGIPHGSLQLHSQSGDIRILSQSTSLASVAPRWLRNAKTHAHNWDVN